MTDTNFAAYKVNAQVLFVVKTKKGAASPHKPAGKKN
jgi:hypothetical protein